MPLVREVISSGESSMIELDIEELQRCSMNGNRQTLRFRVTVQDGFASTNTNSAIARDLCGVVNSNKEIKNVSKGKTVILSLGSNGYLNVSVS